MTNLIKYQRGYQASLRALSAMDDMIDQLITAPEGWACDHRDNPEHDLEPDAPVRPAERHPAAVEDAEQDLVRATS